MHLSIRETRRVRDRAYLQFIVRDTGIGMEKGLLERIFEPFEQGGASISHSYGGSGSGLAISSNLISLMNGHISVSSTPGVGSEFVVELPLLTVPDNTPKQDVSLEDIRVLVVDDDLVTCEHTTLILNRIGVDAEYVTSGKAAVTRVKRPCNGTPATTSRLWTGKCRTWTVWKRPAPSAASWGPIRW